MFEAQIRALDMLEVESLPAGDGRGALLLTASASLVGVGAAQPGGRRLEYASIQLRTDVPHLLVEEAASLEEDLAVGREARFGGGSIHSTSPLLKIAVCDPGVSAEEQEKRLREAAIYLTGGFLRINRTVALPEPDAPEQFSARNLVAYLARKNSPEPEGRARPPGGLSPAAGVGPAAGRARAPGAPRGAAPEDAAGPQGARGRQPGHRPAHHHPGPPGAGRAPLRLQPPAEGARPAAACRRREPREARPEVCISRRFFVTVGA